MCLLFSFVTVRQLTYEKMEARGSERMKTEEEKIKEEKERLEKLEADRLRFVVVLVFVVDVYHVFVIVYSTCCSLAV